MYNYVLIKKLYNSEDISLILDKSNHKKESYSKVGNRVGKKKNKKRCFLFTV